jgi:hypothetical protein
MKEEAVNSILMYTKRKWYKNHKFPLVPLFNYTRKEKHNTSGWDFEWLFLKLWTRNSFDFELAFVIDPTHWGIGITALVPYLRIVFTIPPTEKIASWFIKNTWRKNKTISPNI